MVTNKKAFLMDFIAGKTLSIRVKLVILAVVAVLLTAFALILLGIWQGSTLENLAEAQTEELIGQDMDQVARSIFQIVETQNQVVQTQVDRGLSLLEFLMVKNGGLNLGGEKTRWNAINQVSKDVSAVELPNLMIGNTWIGKNEDFTLPTPLVDDVLKLNNVQATIFQVMNERGDLLRVGTNIQGDNNKRAIGTYIPATQPDGTPNPIVAAVSAGKTYRGLAFVVSEWYVATYKPVTDAQGKTFAVLFVGVRQKDLDSIRTVLANAKIGETGTAFVISGSGSTRGQYIASKNNDLEGQSFLKSGQVEQAQVAEALLSKAVTLKTGEEYFTHHLWQNPSDATPEKVMTRLIYYAPWDWVIGVTAYEKDQSHYLVSLGQTLSQMILLFLIVGVSIALLLTLITWILTGKLIQPLHSMSTVADRLAKGDMEQSITFTSNDEVGELANSLRRMLVYLREMAQAARQIADGDLTICVQPHSEKDGLGQAFSDMINSLHQTLQEVAQNAYNLAFSAQNLNQSAQQTHQATEQIAGTIEGVITGMNNQTDSAAITQRAVDLVSTSIRGVAQGAQEQAQAVDQAAFLTTQLSQSVDRLTQAAQKAAAGGTAVSQASQIGVERVQTTILAMSNIRKRVEISAHKVQDMGQSTEEIGVIAETIDDIASQTNLLALNAAIEAARAGAVGKGFAVVADEVRKLAERAAASTRQVHNLVKSIQATTQESTQAMQDSVQEVAQGVEKANQAGQALESILKTAGEVFQSATMAISEAEQAEENSKKLVTSMDVVSAVVEANTTATGEMATAAEEVHKSMDTINQITLKNTTAVKIASSSTQEMSTQVQQVSIAADALAEMAQALNQVVKKFKIDREDA